MDERTEKVRRFYSDAPFPGYGPRDTLATLRARGARTGVPVLLNTSFNLAGEPIVARAVEGYSTFRRSDIDMLVVEGAVVERRRAEQAGVREAVA